VSSGRLINMVAFVPTNLESEESWTAPGDLTQLERLAQSLKLG
jgi:salicylate hydroxylase